MSLCTECWGSGREWLLFELVTCGVCMKSDDEDTDPGTPDAKKSSGQWRLDIHDCPKCNASGLIDMIVCDLCDGGRKVSLSTFTGWILANPPDTDRNL